MDDGSVLEAGPNDVFDIPPGHNGWVVSEKPMLAINWSGVRSWLPEPEFGDRVLATLMFTDIVGSTELAGCLGDRAWRELLGRHDRGVRNVLDRHRGREVKTTGDGFLAVFDGAGRAVRAAIDMKASSRAIGLEIRAGVHTGEIELAGDDVRGVAVHEAARDRRGRLSRGDPGVVDDPPARQGRGPLLRGARPAGPQGSLRRPRPYAVAE